MTDWAGFIGAALLISLIPGTNQLLGLSNAVRYGTTRAIAGVAGRLASFIILIGLVAAGLGAILNTSGTALEAIKWISVVHLARLGVSGLRPADPDTESTADPSGGLRSILTREFAVAISSPKALLLFAACCPRSPTRRRRARASTWPCSAPPIC
uniref:LysE family translocator n=1 Tax=Paractinoplanes polyasparticus TaxID=2856853 RepID=UPI001C847C71|nr:LysE family translocator [Actinoplanes polyasparticus]